MTMTIEARTYKVGELLELRQNNMLAPNPEYQRGAVWRAPQKKRLIDSVLRNYPISVIYLHHVRREVAGHSREDFEIIDGQQRINALAEFREGAFKLFDPEKDAAQARFPAFIREAPCPWGGKDFDSLDAATRDRFLNTELSVANMHTSNPHEARDLFIRLQAGMPLSPQEKRDAWPGGFTEFILKTAGKPEILRYPGHEFFTDLLGAQRSANRGKFRQLAAQMAMLFLTRRESNGERLCDIRADEIDDFYYEHLDFDPASPNAVRFLNVLSKTRALLGDTRKKLLAHEGIHLMLLVDSLLDDYTRSWEAGFASAFDCFREQAAKDRYTRFEAAPGEFWLRYTALTRVGADRGESIQRRHEFFCQKMTEWLSPELKDPTRVFGSIERELIYYRDKGECQVGHHKIPWSEAEIHHVEPHIQGGRTTIANGLLVCKSCHPRSRPTPTSPTG